MKFYQLIYLYPIRFIFLALSYVIAILAWAFERAEDLSFDISYWAELKANNVVGNPKGRYYHKL